MMDNKYILALLCLSSALSVTRFVSIGEEAEGTKAPDAIRTTASSTEIPPQKNLLLTAHFLGGMHHTNCNEECHYTKEALIAGNNCAVRQMGPDWESLVITEVNTLDLILPRGGEEHIIHPRDEKHKIGWDGPGPWPYYMKVDILERLMFSSNKHNNSQQYNWLGWVDADVRVINATFPINTLLDSRVQYEQAPLYGVHDGRHSIKSSNAESRVDDNGVSVVVMCDMNYDNIINDVFFLKKSVWGKRFLQVWNHFILDNESPVSCGYNDQCPFGVAVMQVAQDYTRVQQQEGQQSSMNDASYVLQLPYNNSLEGLAWRSGVNIQETIFKDELGRLTSSQSKTWKEENVPIQIGPVLLVPTWEGGLRLPNKLIPSSLTIEKTSLFEEKMHKGTWPFALHAKYSDFFCKEHNKDLGQGLVQYLRSSLAIHRDQCSPSELESMTDERAQCWASWQNLSLVDIGSATVEAHNLDGSESSLQKLQQNNSSTPEKAARHPNSNPIVFYVEEAKASAETKSKLCNRTANVVIDIALSCLRKTTPSLELEYPSDAEEHTNEIREVLGKWAQHRGHTMHTAANFGGPWLENIWISHFESLYQEQNQTCVYDIFGPYIPIFVPWTDHWVIRGRTYPRELLDDLKSVLRPTVPYITVSQNDNGLAGMGEIAMKDFPNVLVLSAGGYGHVPLPLFKQKEQLNNQKPILDRRNFLSYAGSLVNAPKEMRSKVNTKLVAISNATNGNRTFYKYYKGDDWRNVGADSWFSLCPRGYGRTSYHLVETLQQGLIPVHIYSDIPWVPYAELFDELGFVHSASNITSLAETLKSISVDEIERRQKRIELLIDSHFSPAGVMQQIQSYMLHKSTDLRCQALPRSIRDAHR